MTALTAELACIPVAVWVVPVAVLEWRRAHRDEVDALLRRERKAARR